MQPQVLHLKNFLNWILRKIILILQLDIGFLHLLIDNFQRQIFNILMSFIKKNRIVKEYLFQIIPSLLREFFNKTRQDKVQ